MNARPTDRSNSVGASEVAALFPERGGSPYKSEYGLWGLKTGLVKDDEEKTERQRMGLDLERPVLELWARRENRVVEHNQRSIAWVGNPRVTATPDAFVMALLGGHGIERGAEIVAVADVKTVQPWARKEWQRDGIPFHYWAQLQHQMLCADVPRAFLVCIFGVDCIEAQEVEADTEFQREISVRVETFWGRVEGRLPPPPVDDHASTRAALLAKKRGVIQIALDNNVLELHESLLAAKKDRTAADKRAKLIEAQILASLGDATSGAFTDGSGYRVLTVERKAFEVKASSSKQLKFYKSEESEDGDE